jgi:hypothetical protein
MHECTPPSRLTEPFFASCENVTEILQYFGNLSTRTFRPDCSFWNLRSLQAIGSLHLLMRFASSPFWLQFLVSSPKSHEAISTPETKSILHHAKKSSYKSDRTLTKASCKIFIPEKLLPMRSNSNRVKPMLRTHCKLQESSKPIQIACSNNPKLGIPVTNNQHSSSLTKVGCR